MDDVAGLLEMILQHLPCGIVAEVVNVNSSSAHVKAGFAEVLSSQVKPPECQCSQEGRGTRP